MEISKKPSQLVSVRMFIIYTLTLISKIILHTFLFMFLKLLTRRICLTIKGYLIGNHFFYSHDLYINFD